MSGVLSWVRLFCEMSILVFVFWSKKNLFPFWKTCSLFRRIFLFPLFPFDSLFLSLFAPSSTPHHHEVQQGYAFPLLISPNGPTILCRKTAMWILLWNKRKEKSEWIRLRQARLTWRFSSYCRRFLFQAQVPQGALHRPLSHSPQDYELPPLQGAPWEAQGKIFPIVTSRHCCAHTPEEDFVYVWNWVHRVWLKDKRLWRISNEDDRN